MAGESKHHVTAELYYFLYSSGLIPFAVHIWPLNVVRRLFSKRLVDESHMWSFILSVQIIANSKR
jgi:hypothetical protein